MPMELVPLRRKLSLRKRHRRPASTSTRGRSVDRPVVATVTGMGTALATRGTERLLAATAVDRVVVVGITGAVDDATPIGSLVRPEVVVDGSHRGPIPAGSRSARALPVGTMWTSDSLITDADALAGLRAQGVVAWTWRRRPSPLSASAAASPGRWSGP